MYQINSFQMVNEIFFLSKIFLLCIQTKMLMDDCSDDSDCGTNYDSGKGGSYLDVYKLSKSTPMIVCFYMVYM